MEDNDNNKPSFWQKQFSRDRAVRRQRGFWQRQLATYTDSFTWRGDTIRDTYQGFNNLKNNSRGVLSQSRTMKGVFLDFETEAQAMGCSVEEVKAFLMRRHTIWNLFSWFLILVLMVGFYNIANISVEGFTNGIVLWSGSISGSAIFYAIWWECLILGIYLHTQYHAFIIRNMFVPNFWSGLKYLLRNPSELLPISSIYDGVDEEILYELGNFESKENDNEKNKKNRSQSQ
ncbi:hypothetical protein [Salinicola aestuarinus]|uniref:hypothetical protein n=1 Tax=Salinicola aestuarinus TaxID=1949082 RepID=UPI0013004B38|nr:hypothetical protein [Salinicola aestuarinus]